jgi:hypothetical protein
MTREEVGVTTFSLCFSASVMRNNNFESAGFLSAFLSGVGCSLAGGVGGFFFVLAAAWVSFS